MTATIKRNRLGVIVNAILGLALALMLGFGVAFLGGFVTEANAASCQGAHTPTACGAANAAANAGPYNGPVAPTTEPMVCVPVLADHRSEVILVQGKPTRAIPLQDLPPMLRWRPSAINWHPWVRDGRYLVGEICLPARLMTLYEFVTFCNGHVPGEGNHSVFDRTVQNYVLRQRRIGEHDPVCLLGTEECGKFGL